MVRRLLACAGIAGSICCGAWYLGLLDPRVDAQGRPLCAMPEAGHYSPGSVARHGDTLYQCVFIYGDQLESSGVSWVKVTTGGRLAPNVR
jgi:hypothetical protein